MAGKPKSKKSSSNKKKGSYKHKYGGKSKTLPSIFPNKTMVSLKYEKVGEISTGTTQYSFGNSTASFYMNAIYNPKTSSGVNNVQGFDQIKDIYGKYKVFGCKLSIEYTDPSQDGLLAGVRVHENGSTDYLAGETAGSGGMKKWTFIRPINDTGKQVVRYSKNWSIAAIEGLTKAQMNGDVSVYTSSGGLTTHPTRSPFCELSVCNTKDATDATIKYKITMEFITQLSSRRVLPTSTVA